MSGDDLSFVIPWAVDSNNHAFRPHEAVKDKTYFCPACHREVILKRGEARRAHFAHKANPACRLETVIHQTAKILIQNKVREYKNGQSESPVLIRRCQICNEIVRQKLPNTIDDALLEHRLNKRRIVDVALVRNNEVVAAIEIQVTHAVDTEKETDLSIPFIELLGEEVINDPSVWEPVLDRFKPVVCKTCSAGYAQFEEQVKLVSKQTNVPIPTGGYYRYGIIPCWACGKNILVFAWPGKYWRGLATGPGITAPPLEKPVPRTIRVIKKGDINKFYWLNTCPYCEAIQGDYFLDRQSNGIFCGAPFKNFDQDQWSIARQWFNHYREHTTDESPPYSNPDIPDSQLVQKILDKSDLHNLSDQDKQKVEEYLHIVVQTARQNKIRIPYGNYYRYAVKQCYHCKKAIVVFAWSDPAIPPRYKPIPPVVQNVPGVGFANVCPFCHHVQKDFTRHGPPQGVFSWIDFIDFADDMLRIVHNRRIYASDIVTSDNPID